MKDQSIYLLCHLKQRSTFIVQQTIDIQYHLYRWNAGHEGAHLPFSLLSVFGGFVFSLGKCPFPQIERVKDRRFEPKRLIFQVVQNTGVLCTALYTRIVNISSVFKTLVKTRISFQNLSKSKLILNNNNGTPLNLEKPL